MKSLESLRKEIDQLHKDLYQLLRKRRDLTVEIWKLKQAQGEPFFDPAREEQILKDFVKLHQDTPRDTAMENLLQGVMSNLLREYEKYLKQQF